MKTNIIKKGLAALIIATAVTPSLTSCGEDYLEKAPITSTSAADIASSIEGARAAKVGLCQGMYRQMSGPNLNSTNGEAWMQIYYGEVFGESLLNNLYCGHGTSTTYAAWTQLRQDTYWACQQMWIYCYNLINWANMIIENIDNLDPYDGERDFIKAVALSMRAHCYTHLVQCYAPNWENANNGDVKCLVIRESSSTEEKEIGTMKEAMDLIYSDLQTAINLFDNCGWKREFIWEPDGTVARGLLARAALIIHDYKTAQQMASEARKSYKIMSADQYMSGFVTANEEYMWATMFEAPAASIYYYATGAYNAANGRYQSSWGYTVNSIDYTLYRKFPSTDIRKKLYLCPELLDYYPDLAKKHGVTKADFWDENKVYSNGLRIQINNKTMNPGMNAFVIEHGKNEFNRLNAINGFLSGTVAAYQNSASEIQFGTQFKFWGNQVYGMNQWPFMRASEMAYTEAECAYRNGDEATARRILNEINKDYRDPEFNCTATGEALLQTIKDYRSFELWGEGYNWFDLKRWHQKLNRQPWVAGDPNSGNRGKSFCQDFGPDEFYGWVVCVPDGEFRYNKLARKDVLPGGNR